MILAQKLNASVLWESHSRFAKWHIFVSDALGKFEKKKNEQKCLLRNLEHFIEHRREQSTTQSQNDDHIHKKNERNEKNKNALKLNELLNMHLHNVEHVRHKQQNINKKSEDEGFSVFKFSDFFFLRYEVHK